MERVRHRIHNFAKTYCVSDQKSLEFVEGVNQLTFEDDGRFVEDNVIEGYVEENMSKTCLRDLGCQGTQTYIDGPLRKQGRQRRRQLSR